MDSFGTEVPKPDREVDGYDRNYAAPYRTLGHGDRAGGGRPHPHRRPPRGGAGEHLLATTQVQEFTLTFVPKIIAIALACAIFGPWMLRVMIRFSVQLLTDLPTFAR